MDFNKDFWPNYFVQLLRNLQHSFVPNIKLDFVIITFREKQRGGKTQGGGKHTINPSPKTVLDPPTYDTISPPPFVHAMSFSLEETGTDQINPTF